jgi:hypothetical protein
VCAIDRWLLQATTNEQAGLGGESDSASASSTTDDSYRKCVPVVMIKTAGEDGIDDVASCDGDGSNSPSSDIAAHFSITPEPVEMNDNLWLEVGSNYFLDAISEHSILRRTQNPLAVVVKVGSPVSYGYIS